MPPRFETPSLRLRSMEALPPIPPKDSSITSDSDDLLGDAFDDTSRNYTTLEVREAEYELLRVLYDSSVRPSQKLSAINLFRKKLDSLISNPHQVEKKFTDIITTAYDSCVDANSVEHTLANLQNMYANTKIQPHSRFHTLAVDAETGGEIYDVLRFPEIVVFAKLLANKPTYKQEIRALRQQIQRLPPEQQRTKIERIALALTGVTEKTAEKIYGHLLDDYAVEYAEDREYEHEEDYITSAQALEKLRAHFPISDTNAEAVEHTEKFIDEYKRQLSDYINMFFEALKNHDYHLMDTAIGSLRIFLDRFRTPLPRLSQIFSQQFNDSYKNNFNESFYEIIECCDSIEKLIWCIRSILRLKEITREFSYEMGSSPNIVDLVKHALHLYYSKSSSEQNVVEPNKKEQDDKKSLKEFISLIDELHGQDFLHKEVEKIYKGILQDEMHDNGARHLDARLALFEEVSNTKRTFYKDFVQQTFEAYVAKKLKHAGGDTIERIKTMMAQLKISTGHKPVLRREILRPFITQLLLDSHFEILVRLKELGSGFDEADSAEVQDAYAQLFRKSILSKRGAEAALEQAIRIFGFTKIPVDEKIAIDVVNGNIGDKIVYVDGPLQQEKLCELTTKVGKCELLLQMNLRYSPAAVDETYLKLNPNDIYTFYQLECILSSRPSHECAMQLYNKALKEIIFNEPEELKNKFDALSAFLQIPITFSQDAINLFITRTKTRFDPESQKILLSRFDALAMLTNILPNPDVVGSAVAQQNKDGHMSLLHFQNWYDRYSETERERFVSAYVKTVIGNIALDARGVYRMTMLLQSRKKEDSGALNSAVLTQLDASPWIRALYKVAHIQGINENEANDQWRHELNPLLNVALQKKIISLDDSADAEAVVQYISEFGMVNDAELFAISKDCFRAQNFENLLPTTISTLTAFGIELRKKSGAWRLPGPKSIINELRVAIRRMVDDLFADIASLALETQLGEQLFSVLRGSTKWEQRDSVGLLMRVWNKTVQDNPDRGKLPNGVTERKITVAVLAQDRWSDAKGDNENNSVRLNELFAHTDFMRPYAILADTVRIGIAQRDVAEWWNARRDGIKTDLESAAHQLDTLLRATLEEREIMVAAEEDDDRKRLLSQKCRALGSENGRRAMGKQLENLLHAVSVVSALDYLQENTDEETLVRAMELLASSDTTSYGIGKSLRELSAMHIFATMPEMWKTVLQNSFTEIQPTTERIDTLASFMRQFVFEHYTHAAQQFEHTRHAPFSKNLLQTLISVWDLKPDMKDKLPIETLQMRVWNICHSEKGGETKSIDIAMVPAKGILRIFSGDFGDACFTSQHQSLARGEYPDLFAWTYVTQRGTPHATIKGSVLGIVAERDDGMPTLVARAMNPKENFIRSVNSKQFVMESLRAVVNTARAIHAAQKKEHVTEAVEAPRHCFCVAIPMSPVSQSSTNRQLVVEVYKKMFHKLPKIGLQNTKETNFNGYKIWDKNNSNGCVVVWEIDENGKETWYGDWKDDE